MLRLSLRFGGRWIISHEGEESVEGFMYHFSGGFRRPTCVDYLSASVELEGRPRHREV